MTSSPRQHVKERLPSPGWLENAGPTEVPRIIASTDSEPDEKAPLLSKPETSPLWSPPIRRYVPVEVVIAVYLFSVVLCLPLIQFYLFDKVAEQYGGVNKSSSDICHAGTSNSSDASLEQKIQSQVTDYTLFLIVTISLPGIFQTFIFGGLSDRQGRRGCLFLAFSGLLIREVIYLMVFEFDLPIGILFIGNVLDGLTGSFGTVLTATFGIVADITPGGPKRAFRIAVVQAVMAMASALGMFLSGVWVDVAGFKQPMYFVIALTGATLLFAIFVLPETRRSISKEPLSCKEHFRSLKRNFQLFTKDTPEKRRWKLIVSLCTFMTSFSVDLARATILILFLLATPFCWKRTAITTYSAIRAVINWLCILTVTRTCGRYISEITIAILACLSNFLFLLFIGVGRSDAMIYIAAALGIFSEAAPPMMRSVMSRLVGPDEQGALFASVSAVEVLETAVLGAVVTMIYKASLSFFPGLVFLVLAFFTLITVALLGTLMHGIKKDTAGHSQTITVEPTS